LRWMRNERGQSMVLFAVSAVALLSIGALSLDAGRAYVLVQHLKKAADAAALAGGQDLPSNSTQAVIDAQNTAAEDGVAASDVTVAFSNDNQIITVTTQGSVPYFFARLFGVDSGTFTQTSAVQVGAISQVMGAVPLGVYQQDFVFGQSYTLKAGAGSGSCGNYMALDMTSSSGSSDNGASQYESNLQYGYQQWLSVGTSIPTETGNMNGPTDTGLSPRLSSDPSSTYQTVLPSSPRVLYVPIISPTDCGKSSVTVLGFAAFFLQSVSSGDVTGQFMHIAVDGQFGSGAGDYGLEAERLIE
jgi:Flp pilus assembly protein TadG